DPRQSSNTGSVKTGRPPGGGIFPAAASFLQGSCNILDTSVVIIKRGQLFCPRTTHTFQRGYAPRVLRGRHKKQGNRTGRGGWFSRPACAGQANNTAEPAAWPDG